MTYKYGPKAAFLRTPFARLGARPGLFVAALRQPAEAKTFPTHTEGPNGVKPSRAAAQRMEQSSVPMEGTLG